VQGGSVKELTEWGWRLDRPSIRLGEQLRVHARMPPGDLDLQKLAAGAPPQVITALKMGRPVVYGIEVTRGDGRTLPLGGKQ
jgi:hypothetical protein